jgi:class 3 adenylate cyclase
MRTPMSSVAEWLAGLGLSEYTDRFVENDVDISALHLLTDQDLKELGVSLGHRRKMLAAIAELEGTAPTPQSAMPPETKRPDQAERRQVTVMFSDLVGSTALSARMDPEDLRELISAYQRCVADTVCRFGGFVAKYMGTGCSFISGIPKLTRMTQNVPCAQRWRRLLQLAHSNFPFRCKPASESRQGWWSSAT